MHQTQYLNWFHTFFFFQIFAKLLWDKPSRRQCPPDLVKCLGCAFLRAGFNLGCNLYFVEFPHFLDICSVNQWINEVLEPSTGQSFQIKGPLFWSKLCDVSERLVWQHEAICDNIWGIQKAKKRWQTHPSFFHICEEGLFLVFCSKFVVWFEFQPDYWSLCQRSGLEGEIYSVHAYMGTHFSFCSAKVCPSICCRGWAIIYPVDLMLLLMMSSS